MRIYTSPRANEIPITDAGNLYNATSVEAALAELRADQMEFGATWLGGSTMTLTRRKAAANLVANAWVGTTPGSNNFDNILPWSGMRRCNLSDAGVVNAYYGDPAYAVDGTNGQVMVEIPKFYYKVEYSDPMFTWWVSPVALSGYVVHPAFVRGGVEKNYIYVSAYTGSYDANSKLQSVSGALPKVSQTRAQFRTAAVARGAIWSQIDFLTVSAIQLLYLVEYASTDSQGKIGKDITELNYSASDTATANENSVTRVVVANATAAKFSVDQYIDIGTSLGGRQVAQDRKITTIDVVDASNKAISFTGAAVNVAIGNIVYNVAQPTGQTNSLGNKSGRAAGTDGKVSASYRGIENPFGNVRYFVDGLNIKADREPYFASVQASFADDTFTGAYAAMGYTNGNADGYVTALNYNAANPWGWLPKAASGGGSNTYVPDYYYQNTGNLVALVGGSWIGGALSGLFSWRLNYSSSASALDFGARLLAIP